MVLKAAFINELTRFTKRRKNIVFLIVNAALCALTALIIQLLGLANFSLNAHVLTLILGMMVRVLMPLYIFMVSADIFSSEYGDMTINSIIVRPVERFKIFAVKTLLVFCYVAANMLLAFVVSSLCSLIKETSPAMFINAAVSYFVSILPLFVLATMSIFLSQLTKSGLLSVIMSVFVYLFAQALTLVNTSVASFSFISYMSWYQLWLGPVQHISSLLSKLLLLASYGFVFFFGGFLLFDKRDF